MRCALLDPHHMCAAYLRIRRYVADLGWGQTPNHNDMSYFGDQFVDAFHVVGHLFDGDAQSCGEPYDDVNGDRHAPQFWQTTFLLARALIDTGSSSRLDFLDADSTIV